MVDPPRTMGKDNLTLPGLKKIEKDQNVQKLVDEAVKQAEAMRDWRHRLLAHRDLKVALDEAPLPIATMDVKSIEMAIGSIIAVLNAVSLLYMDSETAFIEDVGTGGAVALLYTLDDGLRSQAESHQRLLRGEPLPQDTAARNL